MSRHDDHKRRPDVPEPPDRIRRDEPLPWEKIKPSEDDPAAAARVAEISGHASYRRADLDADFLDAGAARGVRLELDFLKPDYYLRRRGIDETIVVFGSTRLCERAEADRRLELARQALAAQPDDGRLAARVSIAERVSERSRYYDVARAFGALVGETAGRNGQATLVTGGGPGIMEAANRGAFDAGAENVGLNIDLPRKQYPNPYVSPGLGFCVRYFAIRKLHFLLRAKALVAFPGGYGTLDEVFETLNLVQCRTIAPLPIVLVGEEFWRQAIDIDFLVDEGLVGREDRALFWYAETAESIWEGILDWHRQAGTPLSSDPTAG